MSSSEFHKIALDLGPDLFNGLFNSVDFEPVAKGRVGNHLVNVGDKGVPIVRTTTKYNIPALNFSAIHHMLVERINDNLAGIPVQRFNNALVEVYDSGYYKMNYHSDHSLDLEDDSYIGLFSCYERPEELSAQHIRKLKIKDKGGEEEFEHSLTHNSVVLFSLAANTKFQHKIVLDAAPHPKKMGADNRWLGITFRTSKTFIRFDDNMPRFANGKLLELANSEQEKEFYKLRGEENRGVGFVYPELMYTVNAADMMMPENAPDLKSGFGVCQRTRQH
ncbi:alpha-ketoglutarate-dependent dioxygenase AlkB [Chitinophaga agrisoli]|uniref:Alpha-ketoglutarate-dependent dioxygenase AlkB n=1 Tax=Chitinophaga agrisoli TaxID=2607653 RepID=A0A5B2VNI1_9BACT|nr:alpha-ketoglutarate-dependent dioxygenase AlkB [Chitinophaga agrisoli]KAA2240268.1 alpha-ketoglutarate-dependent dioxygenase AlkB [Chitinophaga agrisoli]